MDDLTLPTLLQIIWEALHGSDVFDAFQVMGLTFFNVMCVWAFAMEAIQMAEGKGMNLTKLLLRFAVINGVLLAWPTMADHIYTGAVAMSGMVIPDLNVLYHHLIEGMSQMQAADEAAQAGLGTLASLASIIAAIPNLIITQQLTMISMLAICVCCLVVLVSVAGLFFILGAYLIMGPVFIALGMTDAFAGFMYKWIGVVLSFFLVIPLYGAALQAIAAIIGGAAPNLANLTGLSSIGHVFVTLTGPLLALGIIFAVQKIASSLTGAYFGNTGSLAFTIGVAAAGVGARLGLSAGSLASAGSAAGAAASTAGSASTAAARAATKS